MEFAGRTKPIANIFLPAFRAFSMVGVCRFESVQPPSPSGNVLSGPVWGWGRDIHLSDGVRPRRHTGCREGCNAPGKEDC